MIETLKITTIRVVTVILVIVFAFSMGHGVGIARAEAPDAVVVGIGATLQDYILNNYKQIFSEEDERVTKLRNYFSERDLPAAKYAAEFVRAADQYGLPDWRLAAAISMQETTGCEHTIENAQTTSRTNNCFGWGSQDFSSIPNGIWFVTKNLAGKHEPTEHFYKDKSIKNILLTYNSENPKYFSKIMKIMKDIDSEPTTNTNNT